MKEEPIFHRKKISKMTTDQLRKKMEFNYTCMYVMTIIFSIAIILGILLYAVAIFYAFIIYVPIYWWFWKNNKLIDKELDKRTV